MAQSMLSIRIDEGLKKQFDSLCSEFGMTATTAITVFAKTVVRERKIPFEIAAPIFSNGKTRREAVQSLVTHNGLFSNKREILEAVKEGRK
ncbi:type II toxin-antitoxin system RelB/DinJ family antitoxin [Treponema primitia]|uniref:type II toxin-antitoxin system RelB/DinJ family antitoxin n=1 Tax=Treponema primitia TaxID=88058 RepID=UPI0039818028